MYTCLKILFAAVFGLSIFTCAYAQTPPEEKLKFATDTGEAEREYQVLSGYQKSTNTTIVKVDFRVVGSGWYIPEHVDAIKGRIGFDVEGEFPVEPKSLNLKVIATSLDRSKYSDGEKLTIIVDGKVLSAANLKLVASWTTSFTSKSFDFPEISYQDFQKIIEAEIVTFQIGDTKADLLPREIQRLRNLNNSIKKSPVEISH